MGEHTPGPWDATKSGREDGEWSITKHTWGGGSWGNDRYQVVATAKECDEAQANAHLIAAAPELLRELETAAAWLEELLFLGPAAPGSTRKQYEMDDRSAPSARQLATQLRAAIAKARGAVEAHQGAASGA